MYKKKKRKPAYDVDLINKLLWKGCNIKEACKILNINYYNYVTWLNRRPHIKRSRVDLL